MSSQIQACYAVIRDNKIIFVNGQTFIADRRPIYIQTSDRSFRMLITKDCICEIELKFKSYNYTETVIEQKIMLVI